MNKYRIELGENAKPSICHCCDRRSYTGHGFVYKHGDAHAVYYAGWSYDHVSPVVTLALAIGEFSESSSSRDRVCFGLEFSLENNHMQKDFIEPTSSPWSDTALLGKMLSQQSAETHRLTKDALAIADNIIERHPAIQDYLSHQPAEALC